MLPDLVLVISSYLFGSLPFMAALSGARGVSFSRGEDLHIALWHNIGRLEALAGIFVDLCKGTIPILIGIGFGFRLGVVASAGVAAVAGQMWPVFQRFDGEKGNSTSLAMVATLTIAYHSYLIFLIALIPMAIGAGIRTIPRFFAPGQTLNERFKLGGPLSRSLPLGMATGFAIMPLTAWCLGQPLEMTLALTTLFAIIMVRRLTAGLRADLKTSSDVRRILVNRLLYDRSFL